MLFRIIYVSQASTPLPLELKDILTSSRKNNSVLRVTGAMGFIDGLYLQCLEGEESVVNTLYKRIEEDPRHSSPKILVSKPIFERAFPAGRWVCSPGTMRPKRFLKNSTFPNHTIFMPRMLKRLIR